MLYECGIFPDEREEEYRVDEIEDCVEHREECGEHGSQVIFCCREYISRCQDIHQHHQRCEEYHGDDRTDHIEEDMCHRSSPGVRAGAYGRDVCRYGGSDVLSEAESTCGPCSYPSLIRHRYRKCHRGGGGLHDACQHSSCENAEDEGKWFLL